MRSVFSDPIAAGIRSFGDVSDIMERRERAPLEREIMAQDLADKRLYEERTRKTMEFEEKERAEKQKIWGIGNQLRDEIKNNFESALKREPGVRSGKEKWTDSEADALLTASGSMANIDLGKLDEQAEAATNLKKGLAALEPQIMQSPQPKIVINRDQAPELFDSFEKMYGDRINTGTNEHGHSVEQHGIEKKIKSVLVDKTTNPPTISFVLNVTTPVKEGQVFKHIGDDAPKFSVAADVVGMAEKGNIDLSKRSVVRNADGSVSTVRSMSIEEDGKEVLIPTISDSGKSLSREEAVAAYKETGKHLGKFDSVEDANRYAEQLHSDPMWNEDIKKYSAKGQKETSYDAPMTHDHGNDPNAPVVRLPIPILGAHVNAVSQHLGRMQMLQAQLDPKTWLDKKEKAIRARQENKAISEAFGALDTTKSVDEQRKQFVTKFTALMPEATVKETVDLAKTIIPEKTAALSAPGKEIEDRTRFVARYGEGSPEVKDFDARSEAAREKGINKTIYGPGGKTKEVFIKKGQDFTPPKGWTLQSPKEDSIAQTLATERQKDNLEKSLVSRLGGKNATSLAGLPWSSEKIKKAEKLRDRAMELIDQKKTKSYAQAIDMAEKELGTLNPGKALTRVARDSIVKSVKAKKPKSEAEAKKMALEMAKDRGYDPDDYVEKSSTSGEE
jgi:predicted metal-binding transcription factor (methanogenesis marker protein 9)